MDFLSCSKNKLAALVFAEYREVSFEIPQARSRPTDFSMYTLECAQESIPFIQNSQQQMQHSLRRCIASDND